VLAVAGLSLIYVAGENIEPETVAVENISTTDTGEIVTVEGTVASSSFVEGNLFLDIKGETGSIGVSNFGANQNFREGEKVSIEGEVTIYEGELGLVANSIERTK
jgi:DNA/RNA endonuclease YhcR with UshA esterase domain